MPRIGLGTYEITGDEHVADVLEMAFGLGYRLIDTAKMYGNESSIGQAIASSSLRREDVFVTTKLLAADQGYQSTLGAFDASLKRLGLEYVDLYLVHSPDETHMMETWRAMEAIYASGKAKSIGVSNFSLTDMMQLLPYAQVIPAVNQIQMQPFLYARQKKLVELCQQQGIVIEAYTPLSHGVMVNHPVISELAGRYGRTGAQLMLRWAIQHDFVPIPKSSRPDRLKENIEVFDFEISPEDMHRLDQLGSAF